MSRADEAVLRRALERIARLMEPELVFSERYPNQMSLDQMLILDKITERDRRIRFLLADIHGAVQQSKRRAGQ